jgi:integrase
VKYTKVKGPSNQYLFKHKNSDNSETYYVITSKVGKGRLEKSLHTTVLSEARIKRDEIIAQFLGIRPKHKPKTKLVCDKFEEFLELHKIKAKGTYDSMSSQWRVHLKDFFGTMFLDEITETEWLKYVSYKRETHPDRKFFNDRKYIAMFCHWLYRNGEIPKIPKLEDVDPETKAGKVYTKAEIARLLDHSNDNLYLQIILALTMGMRLGEILSLEWSQIDFVKNTIHLPAEKTKIRKARTFGISENALSLLKKRKLESQGDFVFTAPDDPLKCIGVKTGNKTAWTNCRRKAGVSGRFHDLRHTFLTNAFKHAVNPALICNYAGLSLEEAQRTYLHINSDDTRVVSTLINSYDFGIKGGS